MAQVTKQAAKKANHLLDAAASNVIENAAAYGLKPEIAQKFALQCDLLSDHIAKKAGVDLVKLAAQRKQGLTGDDVFDEGTLGFDPEEIGEEVPGPQEGDSDESFMKGEFSQQENRELREKQEGGELGAKTNPEPQAPRSGIQASLEVGAKLANVYMNLHQAASRCASSKEASVKDLGAKLASAGLGVLQFQTRVLEGSESSERVAGVITAAGHILPHLAGDVSPAAAEKLARMAGILAAFAKAQKSV